MKKLKNIITKKEKKNEYCEKNKEQKREHGKNH